jgi:hypothetical protein
MIVPTDNCYEQRLDVFKVIIVFDIFCVATACATCTIVELCFATYSAKDYTA